jgi:hypothetical protein
VVLLGKGLKRGVRESTEVDVFCLHRMGVTGPTNSPIDEKIVLLSMD